MRLTTNYLIILWMLLSCSNVYGQTNMIDSLKRVVEAQVQDSNYVKNLIELGIQLRGINLEEAKHYVDNAVTASTKCGFKRGEMLAYYHSAVIKFYQADFNQVDSFLNLSFEIAEKRGDLKVQSNIENVRGIAYQHSGQLERALNSLQKSASIALQMDDSLSFAIAKSNIGDIHLRNKNYTQSIAYFMECLPVLERIGEPDQYTAAYIGIASAYRDPERKKYYAYKALASSSKYQLDQHRIYALNALGQAYRNSSDSIFMAENFLEEALPLAENYGEPLIKCTVNLDLGEVYLKQKKYNLAEEKLKYAHLIAATNDLIEKNMFASKLLAEVNEHNGNITEAYKYLSEHQILSDSLYNENLTQQIQYSNAQFESERQENELLRQQALLAAQKTKQRVFRMYSLGVLFLLLTLFFGFYQRFKRKRKETELALELEARRNADLEKMSQIKTDFFNNVSHELRTPLSLIISPIEDSLPSVKNVEIKQNLELALKNSKKLLELTNEILDLSKLDFEKLQLEPHKVELTELLKRIYHSFASLTKSRNIQLKDNLQQLPETVVNIDAAKLEKIINNLVINAIKYSEDGSEISLNVDESKFRNGSLKLSIKDRGAGIPKEEQERIFDRFYQSSVTRHASGTGIGLALVKELCTLFNGTIALSSVQGQGSTFTIELPFNRLQESSIKVTELHDSTIAPVELPPVRIAGHKPKLLFVEDDNEMSSYLMSLFEKEYHCEAAYNGKQALDKLERMDFDLICSDVMMPEMDGFEFRTEINKSDKLKNTPFIMLTARAFEADKLKGFQLGIDDYITKPFSSAEFKARVHNLLKNKISRDELKLEDSEVVNQAQDFVSKAAKIVNDNLDNENFRIEMLADELNYSKRQLGRILQKYTGLSPVNFILEIRLQRAYEIIRERKFWTINEVRYAVGIESASYFSTAFKERFGLSPGDLLKNN